MNQLFVEGVPVPQGSKRHVGHGVLIESSKKVEPWRRRIVAAIRAAGWDRHPLDGAVAVRLVFFMPRPKAHFRTGRHAGELRPLSPQWHTSYPDVDKLVRAVFDAIAQSGAIPNDSHIVSVAASKAYADPGQPTGVHIWLEGIG